MKTGNLLGIIILMVAITLMFVGQTLYKQDFEGGEKRDIYNYSETKFVWNSSHFETDNTPLDDTSSLHARRIKNIVYKFADYMGYTMFEIGKWSIEFGYKNPQYDFKFYMETLLWFLKIIIWVMIIGIASTLLLPLFATIYLIGYGVYNLCIWINKRRKNNGKV